MVKAMNTAATEHTEKIKIFDLLDMIPLRSTTQAQRPGARDATIATATLSPGSLQRMVEPSRCAADLPGLARFGSKVVD